MSSAPSIPTAPARLASHAAFAADCQFHMFFLFLGIDLFLIENNDDVRVKISFQMAP